MEPELSLRKWRPEWSCHTRQRIQNWNNTVPPGTQGTTAETARFEERWESAVQPGQGSTFDLMNQVKTLKALKGHAMMTNTYFKFNHSKQRIENPVSLPSGDRLV